MFISIFFIWFLIPLQQTNQSASTQICQLEGKFQDALDPTCTKYYTCSKNSNGSLSQLYHQCLNGSFYSPGDVSMFNNNQSYDYQIFINCTNYNNC
ncbi:hypothetical protein MTP99_012807 [Tenebrio molitor]|nr:hypothetical protein MTP99_012807 [Tenebrio molitor]